MNTYVKLFAIIMSILFSLDVQSQTKENGGWFFVTHTQKLTKMFDLLADVQLRSSDAYEYFNTLLLRTGISYNINKCNAVAIGYAYKGDWEHENGKTFYTLENRIFEQYIYNFKLAKIEMMFRARLEQRFVNETSTAFSQRARAFISAQIPLIANQQFTKGLYTTLQNELFVNVQHKSAVNNHFFDQNRPFISLGYRWSKNVDTEIGYMRWFQKEDDDSYRRDIVQLMVTTHF